MRRRALLFVGAALAAAISGTTPARAIPTLQLYIEGGTYNPWTGTWVTDKGSFTLWVIGNVEADGPIRDVKLSAAYDSTETVSIALMPTKASGIADPSTPANPTPTGGGGDGAVPTFPDGTSLPTHGIFGPGTSFLEWELGDFLSTDSPVGDFINAYPTSFPSNGQINAYDVTVTGSSAIHFDAYGSIVEGNRSGFHTLNVNAPWSHDAGVVPEPNATILYGLAMLVTAIGIRRQL